MLLGPQFALIEDFHAGHERIAHSARTCDALLISLGGAVRCPVLWQKIFALASLKIQGLQIQLVEGGICARFSTNSELCVSS